MADVLVFAFFWLARLHRLGGVAALQNLHTRLFIGADDHTSLLVEAQRLDIELADIMRLRLEVWIVAVEPVYATMRFEVSFLQDTPEAGATHGLPPILLKSSDQIVEAPPRGGATIGRRFPGRYRQHIDPVRGGKSAADDPSAAHLAGR